MTELLYQTDSYLREFEAVVAEVVAGGVVLDRTAFYPGGGGQPSDDGRLSSDDGEWQVVKVKKDGNRVVHTLDGDPPPAGTAVRGTLDWGHRSSSRLY